MIRKSSSLSPDFFEIDCAFVGEKESREGKADDYYNVLMKDREMDIEGKRLASNNLRQPLLVTSTAGIGLSIYQLLPLAVCEVQQFVMYLSWFFFVVTFLAVVASYQFAIWAYGKKIEFTDKQLRLRKVSEEKKRKELEEEMRAQWEYIEKQNYNEEIAMLLGFISFIFGVAATGILAYQVL